MICQSLGMSVILVFKVPSPRNLRRQTGWGFCALNWEAEARAHTYTPSHVDSHFWAWDGHSLEGERVGTTAVPQGWA